jgi:hypothetical protein
MAQVEEDLQEADAKNRLYQLLGERTRREHMAIDQKVLVCVCAGKGGLGRRCCSRCGRAPELSEARENPAALNLACYAAIACWGHRLPLALQVRDKQECLRACNEDLANLTQHFNTTRAAKELAQKEAIKVKRQVEEARADWTRKIRERRAEVRVVRRTGCLAETSAMARAARSQAPSSVVVLSWCLPFAHLRSCNACR